MEISGTVIDILAEVNGQGKNGTWRKQEFILETPSQYPKKVCISMWGDRIDQANLKQGDAVTASIDVESREYNGRWYTEVRAWKVEKNGGAGASAQAPGVATPLPPTFTENAEDDLPF
ncbi:DUF3127 domain-containing protein [Ravibacter arvi]|uniref:DUF3127 domain-containing protein n=1 Tax=Ravibacter arvi TaxID=2051041 RepID=A0ABP8LTV9_9BACT